MNHKLMTGLVIVGLALTYFGYDLFAYLKWGNDTTISRILLAANAYSIAGMFLAIVSAFAFGVLFGHLFLPQHVE